MGKDIRLKFANRLRQLRERKGWTQEELAEYADMAVRQVQYLESKSPSPAKIDTLEKLAKAFKINPSKLLDF
jgi:transcriptional regulator with XRE-family HTH domain